MAVQACEHLNRALVVERETARAFGLEEVAVFPHPKAGGPWPRRPSCASGTR